MSNGDKISAIAQKRLDVEEKISEFYTGFSVDLYGGSQFGEPKDIETYISSIYEKNIKDLVSGMKDSIRELDSIRSKYVPWEIVRDVGQYNKNSLNPMGAKSSFSSSDNKFFYESYENAFMRALGMPESQDLEVSGEKYAFIPGDLSGNGNYVVTNNPVTLKSILSERETIDIRSVKISKNLYDVSAMFGDSNFLSNLDINELKSIGDLLKKYDTLYSNQENRTSSEGVRNFEFESSLTLSFLKEVSDLAIRRTDQEINH